mgnify:CR=1 FL=1
MAQKQLSYKFEIDKGKELTLSLSHGVFIPTGTTKTLVKSVQEYVSEPKKMLDLGCGSGIAGLALYKMGLVKPPLYASDLSERAVESLKKNAGLHDCPVIAKCGPLFEPWAKEEFDYIVDDVSGVTEEVAKISPWFNNVPCASGVDGTSLVIEVIKQAKTYLNTGGLLFFPVVSFSKVDKILKAARDNFSRVKQLGHEEWPLPKEMYQHLPTLKKLQKRGFIQFEEKFGMVLWFTDVYVAYNH